jgi:protein SCO1/2
MKFNALLKIQFLIISSAILILSCSSEGGKLPIYGNMEIVNGDTTYHSIRDFSFMNQDSQIVTNQDFEGKIYVADFFFTTCPTICPKVKQQMLRIREQYKDEKRLHFLSHSIDTRNDSVPALKKYAHKLGIEAPQWHLVTGNKKELYDIAEDYFSIAKEDENAPGGYDHSGYIILIDNKRHIRAFCNGTEEKEVDRFIKQIGYLLDEMKD